MLTYESIMRRKYSCQTDWNIHFLMSVPSFHAGELVISSLKIRLPDLSQLEVHVSLTCSLFPYRESTGETKLSKIHFGEIGLQ